MATIYANTPFTFMTPEELAEIKTKNANPDTKAAQLRAAIDQIVETGNAFSIPIADGRVWDMSRPTFRSFVYRTAGRGRVKLSETKTHFFIERSAGGIAREKPRAELLAHAASLRLNEGLFMLPSARGLTLDVVKTHLQRYKPDGQVAWVIPKDRAPHLRNAPYKAKFGYLPEGQHPVIAHDPILKDNNGAPL